MKKFIVHLHSFANDNIPWTTTLTVEANNRNDAIIKSMNWLIERKLTVNTVKVEY